MAGSGYNNGRLLKRENRKECKQCGRYLDILFEDDICPICQEINLFSEVKDYIRSNDVKEMDVAEHFNIPVSKVRKWIREGRIQYKSDMPGVNKVHCQICGKAIDFGSVCPECHKLQGLEVVAKQYSEDSTMRFLGKDKENKD